MGVRLNVYTCILAHVCFLSLCRTCAASVTLPGGGGGLGLVHGCAHVCEPRQLRRIVVASRQALR